ncbi:Transcriptional regulatory protein ZraR [Candidatus Brocadiaceae bacterium B188]|nr:sigma-54-dependent Fis family transcriptional regulator [Candidatus Brocadia sapporoensis]RZV56732.1 MAG: sigma-54-dependent Fis family transcriptional regulator [Candidatus Brocadia sp. BROELEC01]TWU54211.1 Transcriptional regulatory protein ZraR [Candidatus Brocadiaceae bacterium B188]
MSVEKVLVVDDDLLGREYLSETLTRNGYEVASASDGRQALERVNKAGYDLVFLDMKMPGMCGMEVLEKIKTVSPETVVVLITAYGTIETAVEAMKKGAYDYIIKPFSPDQVELVIARVNERYKLIMENRYWRSNSNIDEKMNPVFARNSKMFQIYEQIKRIAQSKASVLVQGESGTGKELVARAIHFHSNRYESPFIRVNCAALTETLLESELFGHERGAYTGAISKHIGRFELANKGTLLLDEISEISPNIQAKLLRVLEEEEFERVGGEKTIKIDVRIVATTNRNLLEEIRKGSFREDLYYRLNVVPIYLPPLRERREDIPLLTDYYLKKYSLENTAVIKSLDTTTMDYLCQYNWPGNVRELKNVIQRAVVMGSSDVLTLEQFNDIFILQDTKRFETILSDGKAIEDVERDLIYSTLEKTGWNKTRAAELLKITTRTLRNKLSKYDALHKSSCQRETISCIK